MNHRHCILSFLLAFFLLMIPHPMTALPAASAAALSDVVPGSWYEDAVRQMEAKKILTGYPDGTFRPQKTISAAEYVAAALPGQARPVLRHFRAVRSSFVGPDRFHLPCPSGLIS